jgi:hypothetical protein
VPETADVASPPRQPSEAEVLAARIEVLAESLGNLSEQMQTSSALIKELADQNAQLVARIESNRSLLQRVALAASCIGALLLAAVAFLAMRH